MDFDIKKYELDDTATFTFMNAKGDEEMIGADGVSPVTIELFGSGSREAVKALHKAGQAAQARLQALVRGKLDPKAPEKADEEMVQKLAACTKAITNFPIDPATLFGNARLGYMTRQVIRWLDDDANFAKPSTGISASTSGTAPG